MRLFAIAFAVLVISACNDNHQSTVSPTTPTPTAVMPPEPTPPTPSSVHGRVVDFQTAKPLAGAVVGFSETSANSIGTNQTAVTDGNGQYVLPQPPLNGRRYYVLVNNKFAGNAYLNGANNRAGDVAVHDGQCVTRYGFVLDRTTYLPIVGAQILNLSNKVIATTDRDGWYQFDFGCLGPYGFNTTWVIATHPDYISQNFSGGRGWSGVVRDDVALPRK
jgi:hypothetical protein